MGLYEHLVFSMLVGGRAKPAVPPWAKSHPSTASRPQRTKQIAAYGIGHQECLLPRQTGLSSVDGGFGLQGGPFLVRRSTGWAMAAAAPLLDKARDGVNALEWGKGKPFNW